MGPGRRIQAYGRGGREVQRLGAAVQRDADPAVGGGQHLGRQAVRLGAEQPRGRAGQRARVLAGRRGRPRPPPLVASTTRPRGLQRGARRRAPAAPATTGRCQRLPAEARTHLPPCGSVEPGGEHDRVGARRVRGPQDRAGVAGVVDRVEHGDQPGWRPAAGRRRWPAAARRRPRPCGVTVSASAPSTASVTDGDRHAAGPRPAVGQLPAGVGGEQLEQGAGGQRLADRLRALDDEPPLGHTGRAAVQAADRLDPGRPGRRQLGGGAPSGVRQATSSWPRRACARPSAGSAARATSTSAAKAGASVTARSAMTLRSTSTPAIFRPWTNRL